MVDAAVAETSSAEGEAQRRSRTPSRSSSKTGAEGAENVADQNAKRAKAGTTDVSALRRVDGPEGCAKLRAGGIVVRHPSEGALEVLLVSRRKKESSYTVPAGKFEDELDAGSFETCALRETREEAGVEGEILCDLGWYRATGAKDGIEHRTRFFALRFVSNSSSWQEAGERQRCWHSIEEAIRLVDWHPMLVEVLQNFKAQYFSKLQSLPLERASCAQELDCTDESGKSTPALVQS